MTQPLYSRKVILIPADDLAAIQECQDLSAPFQNDPDGSKGMYNKVREHRGRLLDHIRALERAPHVGCFCPHCNPSEDTEVLDRELSRLRRDQTSRVIPVVGALLDFWEMMPNDEKDLVRTTPRLACLLDELDAAMEGDGPFTTDELE